MIDDALEFEDLFEIVTPSAIDRRIHDLDAAWQQLRSDSSNDAYVTSEIAKWDAWAKSVLDSYFTKIFATGVLAELDTWKKRYTAAYSKVSGNKLAPGPESLEDNTSFLNSPLFWASSGLLVAIGIYLYAKYSK